MKKTAFKPSSLKNMKGFTIIEVLMAMGIMSIGLLAVAAMQISAVRNNKTGNTYTQAAALARAQMELIKNGDIDDVADPLNPSAFPGTQPFTDPNNPMDENGNPGGIYTRSWTIDDYLDDTDGDGVGDTVSSFARTVTVTVTFPFVGSGTRQVILSSVTTGGGL
jgi:prepilin-type N-terminal cleavage/methylation domain-containing protein